MNLIDYMEFGGPGSGRRPGIADMGGGKRFAVIAQNPAHNNGQPFVHRSFDTKDEADSHAKNMELDLPHLSTYVQDRGPGKSSSRFNDDVPLGHVGKGLANYTVGDFLKRKNK